MKKYTITGVDHYNVGQDFKDDTMILVPYGEEKMKVSDGYHTMDELYEHRIELFITLCRRLKMYHYTWRSKLHDDGTMPDGWFIMGIKCGYEKEITYHLPLSRWSDTDFLIDEPNEAGEIYAHHTLDRAPEWDGHTSEDVLERLKNL